MVNRIFLLLPLGLFTGLIFMVSGVPDDAFYNDISQSILFVMVMGIMFIVVNFLLSNFE